jgi:hypothetical protein
MNVQLIAPLFDSLTIIGCGIFLLLGRKRVVLKISDPAKKLKTESTLKLCGILAIIGGTIIGLAHMAESMSPASSTSSVSTADLAARFAQKLNYSSPKQLDSITRFDQATVGPGPSVIVDEILMLKASDINDAAWQKFLPQLRQNIMNSQMGQLPAEGIALIIRYSDRDGVKFHDVEFPSAQPAK